MVVSMSTNCERDLKIKLKFYILELISGISPSSILHKNDRIFLPPPPPQNPPPANAGDNFVGDEDDFMVIEIQGNNLHEPRLVLKNGGERKKRRKLSMGDEWIDLRKKDEEFQNVQSIQRSISMDLSVDREFSVEISNIVVVIAIISVGRAVKLAAQAKLEDPFSLLVM